MPRWFAGHYRHVWMLILIAGGIAAADAPGESNVEIEKPLWEIGVFSGVARLPHYRGADEYELYVLPLPYFIYRGDVVKATREGVRGIFYSNERAELSLSFGGNPPVSYDNTAREGMKKLNAVLEAGPQLKLFLREKKSLDPFYISLSAHTAWSADIEDGEIDWEGLHGIARLIYRNRTMFSEQNITYGLNLSLDVANSEFHSYYYDVNETEVLPDRPSYKAGGGYSGLSISCNAVKKVNDRISIGVYYRWDSLDGAVYEGSPLVREKNNHIVGGAVVINLFRSKRMSTRMIEE